MQSSSCLLLQFSDDVFDQLSVFIPSRVLLPIRERLRHELPSKLRSQQLFRIGTEFINIQGDPGMLDRARACRYRGKVDFSPDKTQLLLPSAALQVWLL